MLRACGADTIKLKQELKDHSDQSTPRLVERVVETVLELVGTAFKTDLSG